MKFKTKKAPAAPAPVDATPQLATLQTERERLRVELREVDAQLAARVSITTDPYHDREGHRAQVTAHRIEQGRLADRRRDLQDALATVTAQWQQAGRAQLLEHHGPQCAEFMAKFTQHRARMRDLLEQLCAALEEQQADANAATALRQHVQQQAARYGMRPVDAPRVPRHFTPEDLVMAARNALRALYQDEYAATHPPAAHRGPRRYPGDMLRPGDPPPIIRAGPPVQASPATGVDRAVWIPGMRPPPPHRRE